MSRNEVHYTHTLRMHLPRVNSNLPALTKAAVILKSVLQLPNALAMIWRMMLPVNAPLQANILTSGHGASLQN